MRLPRAGVADRARTAPPATDTDPLLYRAAQETLTNIARYAPGVPTVVSLHYHRGRTCLMVQNGAPEPHASPGSLPTPSGLTTMGGGHGLAGLRERLEQVGGSLHAGPHLDGWQVDVEVPA